MLRKYHSRQIFYALMQWVCFKSMAKLITMFNDRSDIHRALIPTESELSETMFTLSNTRTLVWWPSLRSQLDGFLNRINYNVAHFDCHSFHLAFIISHFSPSNESIQFNFDGNFWAIKMVLYFNAPQCLLKTHLIDSNVWLGSDFVLAFLGLAWLLVIEVHSAIRHNL